MTRDGGRGAGRHRAADGRRHGRGQATAELALALPVLLLILLGVTDFGRVLASTIAVQNAAKQAAVLAARHYVSPISCLQSQAQQLVNAELGGGQQASVTLSEITPTVPVYSGEEDVKATVSYSFTLIAPFVNGIGSAVSPIMVRASDAEHVMAISGSDPGAAQTITATRNISSSGTYADSIGWTMPTTWTPTTVTDPSSGEVYTTTFRIWQSLDNTGAAASPACPVGPAVTAVPTSGHLYLWTHDTDPVNKQYYQYWVVAYSPALAPYIGYAGTPMQAPWP